MIVKFTDHAGADLGRRVMDAIPRAGEGVCLDGETSFVVWNVGWQLYDGEQIAWVSLRTRQRYEQDLARSIRKGMATSAEAASPPPGSSR